MTMTWWMWGWLSARAGDTARGESVYRANCVACHGALADGKGPAARALKPSPTDFTQATYWAGKTDEQVLAAIRTGLPGTSMMGFAQMTSEDLADVVAYLRTRAP